MENAGDINWRERIEKWSWGIELRTASDEDVEEHIVTKIINIYRTGYSTLISGICI